MKNYYRFAEPEEVEQFAENILEHFGGALSDGEALELLAERLECYIKGRLESFGLCTRAELKKPLNDCFDIARKHFDLLEDIDEQIEKSHHLRVATAGSCLVVAIRRGKLEEAIAEALRFAGLATYKSASRSYDRFSMVEFDPLFGDYPHMEDMSPSSKGGILASVIVQARQIWGVDQYSYIEAYPTERHKAALFIKRSKAYVFQYAVRHGTYWKEPEHQTTMIVYDHLRCQIEPEIVMRYLGMAHGAEQALATGVSRAEVYSVYAADYAFKALNEIALSELHEKAPDEGVLDYYFKESQGFLAQALEFKRAEQVSSAYSSALRDRQSKAGKSRAPWGKKLNNFIEDKLIKSGPQKSVSKFAKSILSEARAIKTKEAGHDWVDEHQALEAIRKRAQAAHHKLFPKTE